MTLGNMCSRQFCMGSVGFLLVISGLLFGMFWTAIFTYMFGKVSDLSYNISYRRRLHIQCESAWRDKEMCCLLFHVKVSVNVITLKFEYAVLGSSIWGALI